MFQAASDAQLLQPVGQNKPNGQRTGYKSAPDVSSTFNNVHEFHATANNLRRVNPTPIIKPGGGEERGAECRARGLGLESCTVLAIITVGNN